MKTANRLWMLIVACLLVASCAGAGGLRNILRDPRALEGTWYVAGDQNRRAEIVPVRGGLEARNERGQTSRLEFTRDGDVRALDWEGGLRGEVRRDRIDWANKTTWTREPSRGR